jgi:hypothetical protein
LYLRIILEGHIEVDYRDNKHYCSYNINNEMFFDHSLTLAATSTVMGTQYVSAHGCSHHHGGYSSSMSCGGGGMSSSSGSSGGGGY